MGSLPIGTLIGGFKTRLPLSQLLIRGMLQYRYRRHLCVPNCKTATQKISVVYLVLPSSSINLGDALFFLPSIAWLINTGRSVWLVSDELRCSIFSSLFSGAYSRKLGFISEDEFNFASISREDSIVIYHLNSIGIWSRSLGNGFNAIAINIPGFLEFRDKVGISVGNAIMNALGENTNRTSSVHKSLWFQRVSCSSSNVLFVDDCLGSGFHRVSDIERDQFALLVETLREGRTVVSFDEKYQPDLLLKKDPSDIREWVAFLVEKRPVIVSFDTFVGHIGMVFGLETHIVFRKFGGRRQRVVETYFFPCF